MEFLIPAAMAQAEQAPQGGSAIPLLMIVGMFVLMYFMIIRPQQKRAKEHRSLVSALNKGDEVVMTSGIIGKITKVDEDYLVLDVGNNVELKFQKVAVHAVLPKGTIKSI